MRFRYYYRNTIVLSTEAYLRLGRANREPYVFSALDDVVAVRMANVLRDHDLREDGAECICHEELLFGIVTRNKAKWQAAKETRDYHVLKFNGEVHYFIIERRIALPPHPSVIAA